jgi:hypothetical protein
VSASLQVNAKVNTEASELTDAELIAIASVASAGSDGAAGETDGAPKPSRVH